MGSFLFRLIKWCIIISVLVLLIQFWLSNKSYIFSEDIVAAVAKKHIVGANVKESYRNIHHDLKKNYPGHILPESDLQWIFMNAGGWMGSMCLLHASATEYILFFGTAVDTVGHSGRYWANISDTLLTGEFVQWKEATLKAIKHKPGDTVAHAWGEATAVNFKADTWMVEYGRGFIPSTLGFAMADTIFSTHDFMTMFYILRIYCKAIIQEISHYVVNYKDLVS